MKKPVNTDVVNFEEIKNLQEKFKNLQEHL